MRLATSRCFVTSSKDFSSGHSLTTAQQLLVSSAQGIRAFPTIQDSHLKQVARNTEKLELPSISQVHSRVPVEASLKYPSHPRSIALSEGLPTLDHSRSQDSASSNSPSPRSGSFSSPAAHSSRSSHTSYACSLNGVQQAGFNTPSPEHTPPEFCQHPYSSVNARSYQQSPYNIHASQGYGYGTGTYGSMNQTQPYMDVHHSHLSSGQGHAPSSAPSGLSHYAHYPQPPILQPGPTNYSSAPSPYSQYGYGSQLPSPQPVTHQSPSSMGSQMGQQSLPLPTMSVAPGPPGSALNPGPNYPPSFDTTGQIAPPGMKPRVTATLWEDEGSLCFQVEAKGVCVARREDNHMINGTKLLNVAGMTRGRRDGILKSEKTRHVVKIGPMHLKGVWIPFDRALDFANKEKITELLYPLFVHDIGALLYHPSNQSRTNVTMAAAERRRNDQQQQPQYMRGTPGSQPPTLHHHHTMNNPAGAHVPQPPHSIAPHPGSGRPGLDRAHTFPTPPTSASSVMGLGNQGSSYEWGGSATSSIASGQPISIENGLTARSLPTTPASTPPATSMHSIPQYQTSQPYDNSRHIYSGPPSQANQYAHQPHVGRYGQQMPAGGYGRSHMAPPGRTPSEGEVKSTDTVLNQGQSHEQLSHGTGEEEAEHEHEGGYTHTHNSYGSNRGTYYSSSSNMSPDMASSPAHSGRTTPRTATAGSGPWPPGYGSSQRSQVAPSALYNAASENRAVNANGNVADGYPASGYAPQTYQAANGGASSNKRAREPEDDDPDYRPSSHGESDVESLKRRKIVRENTGESSILDRDPARPVIRTRSAGVQRRR